MKNLTTSQASYLDKAIEYAILTKSESEIVAILNTENGFQIMCDEYNAAYVIFLNKVMNMPANEKSLLMKAIMTKTYYSFKKEELLLAENNEFKKLLASI